MMQDVALSALESEEEIYENQRVWIGRGFSSKGLLPGERKAFSSQDGSVSWKTVEEAEKDLLLDGWEFDENEQFCPKAAVGDGILTADGDLDGWSYAKDFSKEARANSGKVRRKTVHWVRFRSLVRKKRFNPDQIIPQDIYCKCDHGDSQVIKEISKKMIDALAYATLGHNDSNLNTALVLPLKKELLKTLDISKKHCFEQDSFAALLQVHCDLEYFANTNKKDTLKIFSIGNAKKEISFTTRSNFPEFVERRQSIVSKYLTEKDVRPYVDLLIRSIDSKNFKLHCDQENCGETCEFCPEPCQNNGCKEVMSRKHLTKHDNFCEWKLLLCKCGEQIPRCKVDLHLKDSCPLRTVKCPFHKIGCVAMVMAKDLENHVETCTNKHLLLTVDRMMEYQEVIKSMKTDISVLRDENKALKSLIDMNDQENRKVTKTLTQDLKVLTKKFTRLESTANMEFKRIRARSRERG